VVFRAGGATFGRITTRANDVHYIGLSVPGELVMIRAGQNVTVRDAKAEKPYIWAPRPGIDPGDPLNNITIINGEFGPHVSCGSGFQVQGGARNLHIIGNSFRDFTVASTCPDAHLDCLHTFRGIDGMVISGNTFTRCHHFAILMNSASNVLVENNFLDGTHVYGFKLRGDNDPSIETFDNITIRHNSADEISLGTQNSNTLHNILVESNATLNGITCRPGVTYRFNLAQTSSRCSADDLTTTTPIGFADPNAGNFHLSPNSPAVDRLTTGPTTDINGTPRPQGPKHDIGAHEVRAAALLRPSLERVKRTLRLRGRSVALRVVCPRPRSGPARRHCAGTVRLRRARARGTQGSRRRAALLGRKRFSIRSGRAVRLKLRLRPAARRAVRRRPIRAQLRVVVRGPGGRPATQTRRVIVAAR
jgi:hypothetical protein